MPQDKRFQHRLSLAYRVHQQSHFLLLPQDPGVPGFGFRQAAVRRAKGRRQIERYLGAQVPPSQGKLEEFLLHHTA